MQLGAALLSAIAARARGRAYNDSLCSLELNPPSAAPARGNAQGVLPWGLPAGKVAVALGAEYRLEQQTDIRDPLQIGAIPGWGGGNFAQFSGAYHVEEGFLEVNAPLLRNNFVQSLDFNAAGRITSYSTSGTVQTWKLGLTSQINEDIRVRASWSDNIRAPFISELFTSQPP